MSDKHTWHLEHTYKKLPAKLYSVQQPSPVSKPEMVYFNSFLAGKLGLDFLNKEEAAKIFSGNTLPDGAQPIAQAYAGHQFGHFTMLGDGRAILLGEQTTPTGSTYDIQLKGAGQTPYSRRGDGRATLSAMLREYLISEAMHYLGIPTSRSLAVVRTGEKVYRDPIQEGAILTRIASSHIRVGTFEYLRQWGTPDELKQLTDYVINRHYPKLKGAANPALELLKAVMEQQIDLMVNWTRVGFIHGVMNTDNMSIAGETIDYGPCAFMNAYDPMTVFSSIDTAGRYAFGRQPRIAHWNLAVFAGTLIPLIAEKEEEAIALAQETLDRFPQIFSSKWYPMMCHKIGILNPTEEDNKLIDDLLDLMKLHQTDFTNFFLALTYKQHSDGSIFKAEDFKKWEKRRESRIRQENDWEKAQAIMISQNPVVIPRNHLVESALEAAVDGDIAPFKSLLMDLSSPYQKQRGDLSFQTIPSDFDRKYQTFCGT